MLKEIECLCDDCISWKKGNGCSDHAPVTISCDGCERWMHYAEHKDYNNLYWIACLEKGTGERYRKPQKGKRIEVEGIVLYTSDNVERGFCECQVTEGTTGFAVPGGVAFDEDNRLQDGAKKKIQEGIAKLQPVKSLPVSNEICADCLCRVCARNRYNDSYNSQAEKDNEYCEGCNSCHGYQIETEKDCPRESFLPDENE